MNADIGSIGEDSDHVEPQCIEVRFSGIEVMLGDGAQGALLAGSDGFERVSVTGSAPQFDLDEDEYLGFKIQTLTTPPVMFRVLLTKNGGQRLELART